MTETYDRKTIAFHWISAILVLALWTLGQLIDDFSKGDPRIFARSTHIALGLTLIAVYGLRLRWRATQGTQLPPADPGPAGKVATGVHHLLYLLMGLSLALGLTAALVRGDLFFNLFQFPALASHDSPWRDNIVNVHAVLVNTLFGLAGCHGLIALWHHRVRKDGVLIRMIPRLGAPQ